MSNQPNVRFLHPERLAKVPAYTPVVEVRGGRTVYISGQLSLDEQSEVVGPGDFEAQARQTFRNLQHALTAVGLGFQDVVKLGMFITDFAHLDTLRRVRNEFVNTARPPASTLVQVAALFHPELLFEADAIAVAPD